MDKVSSDNLRVIPCLSKLRLEELDLIAKKSELRGYTKDTLVFAQSDPIKFFFIVETGLLKAYKSSPDGRELAIEFFEPGDHFCFPLHHHIKAQHIVNTIALKDSTLIIIPSEIFDNLLKSVLNETGYRVVLELCNKIHLLSDIIDDMAFKNVEQRVIKALFKLSQEQENDTNRILIKTTHQKIAFLTGTVREVVARTMSKLKNKGVVLETNVQGITIDIQKLKGIYEFFDME